MKRNTFVLIGLFLLLLVIAFLILQKPGEQSATSASAGLLFMIDSLSVDKMNVKIPSYALLLEKRGGEWFITQPINYRADQDFIGQIIHQIKNLEVKSIVSNKTEKQSAFRVDSFGIQIKLYEKGAEKASFILGKPAENYTESYARKFESNDILLVEGAFGYTFNRPMSVWRDRTVYATSKENIKEVQYQYGDTIFTVALKDTTWFIGKDKAQQSVMDGILSSLSNFQANDFIDSTISPKITAKIIYAGVQLRFSFNKTANKYYVQSSYGPQWFVLELYKANQVLKRKKEILEANK